MKTPKSMVSTLLILSTLFFTPGCQSPTPVSPIVITLVPLINSTVAGAIIVGAQQDTNVVAYASLAKNVILSFTTNSTLAPSALAAALNAIQINGVSPTVVKLVATGLVGIYESFAQQVAVNGVNNNGDLVTILNAMVTGIDEGEQVVTGSASLKLAPGVTLQSRRAVDIANYQKWKAAHP
jgi:hypothetical protein